MAHPLAQRSRIWGKSTCSPLRPKRGRLVRSESLRCEFKEFHFPDDFGVARIVFTYFELAEGRSLVFRPQYPGHTYFELACHFPSSWLGIECAVKATEWNSESKKTYTSPLVLQLPGVSVEYDFNSSPSSSISVDRSGVTVSPGNAARWRKQIAESAEIQMDEILEGGSGDFFSEINLATQQRQLLFNDGKGWFLCEESLKFGTLQRPMAIELHQKIRNSLIRTTENERVQLLFADENHLRFLPRPFHLRVIAERTKTSHEVSQKPCIFWPSNLRSGGEATFPREWENVTAFQFGTGGRNHVHLGIINYSHPLIELLTEHERSVLFNVTPMSWSFWVGLDNATTANQAAFSLCLTAVYFAGSLARDFSQWQIYADEKRVRMKELWHLIARTTKRELSALEILICSGNNDILIGPDKYRMSRVRYGEPSLLPLVEDPEFLLYESQSDS